MMKRKYLIYIPLIVILLIQVFDKNDHFLWLQYVLLAIAILALILKLVLKKEK